MKHPKGASYMRERKQLREKAPKGNRLWKRKKKMSKRKEYLWKDEL